MSRYRILRLITWLPQGGIERKIVAVLPKLNKELFDVRLCCIRERGALADDLEQKGIPVHLIPFKARLDPVGLWKLNKLVKNHKIDLIHSHMYRSNTPATALKIFNPQLSVIGHYHNVDTWESPNQFRMDRFMALRRDMNVAVSEAVRENVVENLDLPEEITTTLYNCVDLDEFKKAEVSRRQEVRKSLGFSETDKVVVMVARMVGQKNYDMVLRTAPEILQDCPETRFLLVGGGPDQEALEVEAKRLGISESVKFLGRRDDIPDLLGAADLSILPSFKEGFSNAVLEAMASGLPVIASDVGGNREIIEPGINGYLLDTAPTSANKWKVEINETQFVRLMKRVLSDDEHRHKLAGAAWDKSRHYGIDAMVREIEQLYLEILEKR